MVKGKHDEEVVDSFLHDRVNGLLSVKAASRHRRVRRQLQMLITLDNEDREIFVNELNQIRSFVDPMASNMEQLVSMNYVQCWNVCNQYMVLDRLIRHGDTAIATGLFLKFEMRDLTLVTFDITMFLNH